MAVHDRYEQDILNALKGINSSLKRIADALVLKNDKKTIDKNEGCHYYKAHCPTCFQVFTFTDVYWAMNGDELTTSVICPICYHDVRLPKNWREEIRIKTNEQNNEN